MSNSCKIVLLLDLEFVTFPIFGAIFEWFFYLAIRGVLVWFSWGKSKLGQCTTSSRVIPFANPSTSSSDLDSFQTSSSCVLDWNPQNSWWNLDVFDEIFCAKIYHVIAKLWLKCHVIWSSFEEKYGSLKSQIDDDLFLIIQSVFWVRFGSWIV